MVARYFLGVIFLFIVISKSVEFQLKTIFIPLYVEKIQLNVEVDTQCANQIISDNEHYKIPKNCLQCTSHIKGIEIEQCNFVTTGAASFGIARDLIKTNGNAFSTYGYIEKDKVSLRHKPTRLIILHIFIWLFGLVLFFFIVNKKFKLSRDL